MATGNVKLTVQLQAQDRATKALRSANRAIESNIDAMVKAGAAQTKLGAKVALAIRGQGRLRAALIATADSVSTMASRFSTLHATMLAVLTLGVRWFAEFTKEGEIATNVTTRFAQAVPHATAAIEGARKATAGLVEAGDLEVIFNRFVRLGVPVRETTRLLELATKASLDQGKGVLETVKILETAVRGETTALMEIGVNLDETGRLVAKYAEETGRATSEISKMEARLKVALPAALKALGDQFDDVNLKDFQLDMQRVHVTVFDLISDVQKWVSKSFNFTVQALLPSRASIAERTDDLLELTEAVNGLNVAGLATAVGTQFLSAQTKAAKDLGRALAAIPIKQRVEKWRELTSAMAQLPPNVRELVREFGGIRDALKEVNDEITRLPTAGDLGLGGILGASWSKIRIEQAKASEREKKRRSARRKGWASQRAREAAALEAAAKRTIEDVERLSALRSQVRAAEELDEIERARIQHHAKIGAINRKVRKIQDATIRDETAAQQRRLADLDLEKEIARVKKDAADKARAARERARAAREKDAADDEAARQRAL